jgi:hypothetical protein
MIPRPWSDDEDRKLIEMRAAGKSFLLIAKALGRSEMSCRNRWYGTIKKASDREDSSGAPSDAAP